MGSTCFPPGRADLSDQVPTKPGTPPPPRRAHWCRLVVRQRCGEAAQRSLGCTALVGPTSESSLPRSLAARASIP